MASNNECIIVVLDVRQNADEDFKQKSVKCVADIVKEKICNGKKDYISFLLLGTENTLNDLNGNVSSDDYTNIVQYPHVQECTWQLLTNFYKLVNEPACKDGDWLDALVLAMQVIKQTATILKFQRSRIVLFYDFNGVENNYDQFDTIVEALEREQIQLIIVSHNVVYIDNRKTGQPEAIFNKSPKTKMQQANEAKALELARSCADLCNFVEAPHLIHKANNKRPWPWNATFTIGTQIKIPITGTLAVKDDTKIHMKKRWGTAEQQVNRVLKSYLRGEEIHPLPMDLIDAYMLGRTPTPYEADEDADAEKPMKGLRLLGFAKRQTIWDEYLCGQTTYTVIHQRGQASAAKKLMALVLTLQKLDLAMLCWKVYSEKFNTPKVVVLVANELTDYQPASLKMIEHIYSQQQLCWKFPSLDKEREKCTPDQLEAVDELIDSMDLLLDEKSAQSEVRASRDKDLMAYDSLPHIYEQNMMDFLERKIINASVYDDDQFLELLKDKNFVEVFWKVPEGIEEEAKSASKRLKDVFPLERSSLPFVRLAEHQQNAAGRKPYIKAEESDTTTSHELTCHAVGAKTPAEDFRQLIRHKVMTIADRTIRDARYQNYSQQMQMMVVSLLEKPQLDGAKVAEAMRAYREVCLQFNTIDDYNEWIRQVKDLIVGHKLHDFWRSTIVKDDLGLCFFGDLTVGEQARQNEFYRLPQADDSAYGEMEDTAIDSLLASMDA